MNLPKKPEMYFRFAKVGFFFTGKNRGQSLGATTAHD